MRHLCACIEHAYGIRVCECNAYADMNVCTGCMCLCMYMSARDIPYMKCSYVHVYVRTTFNEACAALRMLNKSTGYARSVGGREWDNVLA